MDGRVRGQLVEMLGPVVGDDGRPADVALAVLDEHVEERVERVQPALVGDLPEALADQRRVRAFDDLRVVKVAVPQRRSELHAVERAAEPPAVLGVGEQFVALQLIAQMQRGGACAEFLEHGQIDSVGVQLERNGQMLEAHERSQQLVDQPGARAEHAHRAGRRLGVGRHQQAHPYARAPSEHAAAGQEEVQRRHRALDIGSALQDPAVLAQYGDQLPPFPPRGEGRRQRPRSEAFTVEFVDRRVHPGHAEKPCVERLFEHRRPSGRARRRSGSRRRSLRGRGRAPRCAGPNARAWN